MNRTPLVATARWRVPLSGPLGSVLSVLLGAAVLIVVGPVLGRGFEPVSGPADFVTVPGATATGGAPEGLMGALSEALRALGVGPAEPDAVQSPGPDGAQVDASDVATEFEAPESTPETAPRNDLSVEPDNEIFVLAVAPIAPATTAADVAAEESVEDGDGAGALARAETSEEPEPRPRPVSTRAPPLLPAGLNLTVVATLTAPTPRPQVAPADPTANRQPRAVSTPRPTTQPRRP